MTYQFTPDAVLQEKIKRAHESAPWRREKTWLGANGVASKELRRISRRADLAKTPTTIAKFLAHPLWHGASVSLVRYPDGTLTGYVDVVHPGGARARLRAEGFEDGAAFLSNLQQRKAA